VNKYYKYRHRSNHALVGRLVDGGGGIGWGGSVGRLGNLSGVDGLTLVLNVGDESILIGSVGHNLGAGVGESNTVRSAGPVTIAALTVAEVVGVGVADSVLIGILGRNISIDLDWNGSWTISRSWGGGIALGPGEGNSSEGGEGKDLDLGQG
jgi:hypothetical protein